MSDNHYIFNKSLFLEFRKAAIWSFRLAWKTSPGLFSAIIACFSLEIVIPVSATATIGVLVSKFNDAASQSFASFEVLMFWLGLVILQLAIEFSQLEVRKFSRLRLVDETSVNLQKELYLHIARMDLAFFERSGSLNRLFRVINGGGNGAFGPIHSAMDAAAGIAQIILLFVLMIYLQPLLACILFIAGVPLLVIRSLSSIEKFNLDVKTTQKQRMSQYFTSRLSDAENVAATKILGLADEMIDRFERIARSIILEKKAILTKISIRLGISIISYLSVLVFVVVWLSYRFSLGEIEVGAMVAFLLAAFRALRSIGQVSNALASGADAALSIVPLLEFLQEKPKIFDQGGRLPKSMRGDIVLDNISFAYPGTDKKVINNLSISIAAGEKVAIVGNNGAGKTTLSKLIARFYDVDNGQIWIDEIKIEDLSLRWLHKHIAMVFQKPIQFEATVHENIAFGDWERLRNRPNEVRELASKVGLTDFIENLPDGFDTHLGKLFGDVTLSQGQWQLLDVTRAMACKDAILILDEPTSNLDINAEAAIFSAIRDYSKDKTVLFVSHRFSTVKEADRILVLDEGQLIEDGTHEQLMINEGYYAAMVRYQKSEVRV